MRWAAERGLDVATRAGLEPSDAERDELPVTARTLATMLELASEGAPHVALELPAALRFRRYDAGALAARVAATPRAALEAFARFGPLVFPRLEARVTVTEEVVLSMQIAGAPRGLGHQVDEYVLATALGHCRRGGTSITPRRVWLTSARPHGPLEALERAFGIDEIDFGREDTGFALTAEDAATALPAFDPMLVAVADQIASAALAHAPRPNALAATVAAKIEALLPGDATAEAIAAALKMSARTLQRRLEEEGHRYSSVLDDVRARVAKRLLADPSLGLGEIAYRIGFCDLATFSRAFKRWTGVPPGTYRRLRSVPLGRTT
jgi:AraC-like DNA-binding protein